MAREDTAERTIMQRENERARLIAVGKRTDDNTRCILLAVSEIGDQWCLYPHGAGQLGVRLPKAEAERIARAILGDVTEKATR